MYTQQWYKSYRFVDNFRTGPGWNCSSILVLFESCRVSCQNKFVKLVHLFGFIIKQFVSMHGHMNVYIYIYIYIYIERERERERERE